VNTDVRRIADAVLYEGYILYPYRASAQKNRSRWQFGVLMPSQYTAADPYERSMTQAECVFEHSGQPSAEVTVRFLQVQRRTVEETSDPAVPPVWDEAVEHEVTVMVPSASLLREPSVTEFAIPGGEEHESLSGARVARRREPLAGSVSVRATPLDGPWQAARLTVQVSNLTRPRPAAGPMTRDQALPAALVAAHMIITVSGGAFFSMTDPPEWVRPEVAACENTGCWPVLAGPPEARQVMLASPIILPDHPEVAAESPGELYDGTEIDEILTLRTLALSEEEKDAARATDPRAAALIDRVDAMDPQTMARLHGTIRSPRPGAGQPDPLGAFDAGAFPMPEAPWWDPEADASVSPETDSVTIDGRPVARGSRVRLRPGARRADAQDMFLVGRIAEVQAVLHDVDDVPYLAVSLADQPDEDLRIAHGRFLYFMTDEVEPVS
jgi:hypothetical protein